MLEVDEDRGTVKSDESLPLEISGARQKLTELLAKWQRQARGLVAMNNLARVVVSSPSMDDILAAAVLEIEESLEVIVAQVALLDPESGQIIFHGRHGMKGTQPVPAGEEGIMAQVIRTGNSLQVDHDAGAGTGDHPAWPPAPTLCVPLVVSDGVLGAVQVSGRFLPRAAGKAVPFDEQDQEVLEGLAAFLAMGVQNARLQEATRAQAATQALQDTVVTLAHYVNNPLQGMIAAAELLKERLERTSQVEELEDESSTLGLLEVILEDANTISAVLRLLQDIDLPQSTTYVGSEQMLDIERQLRSRIERPGARSPSP